VNILLAKLVNPKHLESSSTNIKNFFNWTEFLWKQKISSSKYNKTCKCKFCRFF